MSRLRGAVIFQGASRFDGEPLAVIVTGLDGSSQNPKTGTMAQGWILRADVEPHIAAKDGRDASICGSCPHRYDPETGGRSCYVRPHDAPLSIWRAWRRGIYPELSPATVGEHLRATDLPIRIGAYGDPMAVPHRVWSPIVNRAPRVTAYSHAWSYMPHGAAWQKFVMASTDSPEELAEARAAGWRSFRIAEEPGPGEIECPSTRGVACADCGLCAGLQRLGAKDITIPAHGSGAKYIEGGSR